MQPLEFNPEQHPTVSANPQLICPHFNKKTREDLIEELLITSTVLQNQRIELVEFTGRLGSALDILEKTPEQLGAARKAILKAVLHLSYQIENNFPWGGYDDQDKSQAANN